MLTHLLFSISALIVMVVFMITYFSYKKSTNFIRSKIYVYMILFALFLTIIEIVEGIAYIYNISILFSLMWKLHSILIILFISGLFYYFLAITDNTINSIENLIWNYNKVFCVRNIFTIIFLITLMVSIVLIKTYPMGLTMFYFYTNQSMQYLFILYAIYFIYNFYIVYLKYTTNGFVRNDYIILIGTFILFVIALFFENEFGEISIYSTLFTLVLILIYYFKENEDLLMIEELQKQQNDLYYSSNLKLQYLHELTCDIESPLNAFNVINKNLENCANMTDEELNANLSNLNFISNNLVDILSNTSMNGFTTYRIDELVYNIEETNKPSIGDKSIKLSYSVEPTIPSLLIGDRSCIHRIISGLLVNAIESTEVGRIILGVTGERRKDYELLTIIVSDTGKGIKKEDYAKVFQINSNNGNKKSDLSLIKKYVDSMNGKITFESNYGSGTIFYVTIAQKIADERPISQIPFISNDVSPIDLNNKKVLLVDGEEYSSKKLTTILGKYNLNVECIDSGRLALNKVKDGGEYDLIIINDNIKDVGIEEVGQLFKYLGKIVKVPPLVALIVNENRVYLNNSYEEYVLKPINIKKLDDVIKRRCK